MLGTNQQDFINYQGEFKTNYRKGVHRLRTILNTPTQATEFADNVGGVSVVLGVAKDAADRNSEQLYALLRDSAYFDRAITTWMHGFYEFTDADALYKDDKVLDEMVANPLVKRTLNDSLGEVVGKMACGYSNMNPKGFDKMEHVVASREYMQAIAEHTKALRVISDCAKALQIMTTSENAMSQIWESAVGSEYLSADDLATTAFVKNADVSMKVLATKTVGMTKASSSKMFMDKVAANAKAVGYLAASEQAMKILAEDPIGMKSMAASETAMAALAANNVAVTVLAASETAMAAIANSTTATTAITKSAANVMVLCASPVACAALAKDAVSMAVLVKSAETIGVMCTQALAASSFAIEKVAMDAICANATSMFAVASSPVSMNIVMRNKYARETFMKSTHLNKYFNEVMTDVTNTKYFAPIRFYTTTPIETTTVNTDLYASSAGASVNNATAATVDNSIAVIDAIMAVNSASVPATITDLLTGTTQATTNSTSSTPVAKVIIGGFKYRNAKIVFGMFTPIGDEVTAQIIPAE